MKEKRYKNGKIVITEQGIGRISFYIDPDNCAYVSRLNVRTRHQHRGWGNKLLTAAVNACAGCYSVRLHVGIHNLPAILLYEKHGFFKVCLIEDKSHWFMAKAL